MNKEFELNPCPFCKGEASIEVIWVLDPSGGEMECRLIICHGCNAQMQDGVESLAELVGKWNTRHDFAAGRALGRREMKGEAKEACRAAVTAPHLKTGYATILDRRVKMTTDCAQVPGPSANTVVVTTRGEQAKLVQQARADALREAANALNAHCAKCNEPICCGCGDKTTAVILALIDQPQEDVCEWEFKGRLYEGEPWYNTGCHHGTTHRQTWSGDCPHCGKPIKLKSQ